MARLGHRSIIRSRPFQSPRARLRHLHDKLAAVGARAIVEALSELQRDGPCRLKPPKRRTYAPSSPLPRPSSPGRSADAIIDVRRRSTVARARRRWPGALNIWERALCRPVRALRASSPGPRPPDRRACARRDQRYRISAPATDPAAHFFRPRSRDRHPSGRHEVESLPGAQSNAYKSRRRARDV